MENSETKSLSGYGKPPWVFKGSAFYQFHLVKAETARVFIPKEFKLVEAFGYTLGGFFLANYEDSPAGRFDELVVIAGIVWNPPTSCAWAARVLVNSDEACAHGRKAVGLPSQVVNFTKVWLRYAVGCVPHQKYDVAYTSNSAWRITAIPKTRRNRLGGFLGRIGMADISCSMKNSLDIHVKEMRRDADTAMDICSINLNTDEMAATQNDSKRWIGPPVKISLPSFSGRTEENPHLLKYSCQIECRVRAVSPAMVSGPYAAADADSEKTLESRSREMDILAEGGSEDYRRNLIMSLMLSKPILALEFNYLKMKVEAPTVVSQ